MSTIKVTDIKAADGTSALTIADSSGNVGIGTTNPGNKFVVAGTAGNVEFEPGGAVINFTRNSANYINATGALGYLIFSTGGTESLRIDSSKNLKFDSGYGSVATAYGCRAWVNFNGTGTVAIRASGNVSSITDNGTGDYTVNFTNSMPDNNFCSVVCGRQDGISNGVIDAQSNQNGANSTTANRILVASGTSGARDALDTYVAIFR